MPLHEQREDVGYQSLKSVIDLCGNPCATLGNLFDIFQVFLVLELDTRLLLRGAGYQKYIAIVFPMLLIISKVSAIF